MERAHKASWRLTFVAWSGLLVVWAIVTVTMDRDTLLLVKRLAGERGHGAIAVVGLVIALPLLVDVTRNVHRTYRLWLRRTVHDRARASWSERVPVSTPRTFRQSGTPDLTRRERAIVEQGQLAYGRVEHHGELTGALYLAPWGETIASRPVVLGERPRQGARVPLLFEQGARVGVAPGLHQLEFLAAEPDDARAALDGSTQRAPRPRAAVLSLAVHATLHPVLRAAGSLSSQVGELTFDGVRLKLSHAAAEPTAVPVDQPLRVELSAFVLPGGMAELNVCIDTRTSSAYRAGNAKPLRFKTELPQHRIDQGLQRAWVDACYLAPRDFDVLWALIVEAANDATLSTSVSLS